MPRSRGLISVTLGVISLLALNGALAQPPYRWGTQEPRFPRCEVPADSRMPASEDGAAQEEEATIVQHNRSVPVERLRSKRIKVIPLEEIAPIDPWSMPDPYLRDRLLAEAELTNHLANWDQLDLDMLFIRAQWMKPSQLVARYPGVPSAKLQRLIKIVREEKRKDNHDQGGER